MENQDMVVMEEEEESEISNRNTHRKTEVVKTKKVHKHLFLF
jgi:hypothetical protein